MSRARVTITDLLWYTVALAVFATLWPVALNLLARNAEYFDSTTMTVFQSIGPLLVLVLLASIYMKARVGAIREARR